MKKIFKLILVLVVLFSITGCNSKKAEPKKQTKPKEEIIKKVNIIDETSKSRPYAVVINNINVARKVQTGLSDAQVIYEILAEGGITRFIAVYKDKTTEQIGTVRSARHNFLDIAFEYDAIFAHFGGSTYAYADIKSTGINDLDGMTSSAFWRSNPYNLASEHTAYTSIPKLKADAEKKKYKTTTDVSWPLKYSANEINLSENSIDATELSIPFSNYTKNTYTYDKENKVYKRYVNGTAHIDMKTKEHYIFKNIIIARMDFEYTDSNYYLNIKDIGTGSGYFITNGKAIEITWSKQTRNSKTVYKDKKGNEIKLNDGNTFIELQPTNQKTTIK